jgi:hypothetical protein
LGDGKFDHRYDYALLKLKRHIKMPKYIEIIKNYQKSSGKMVIKSDSVKYDGTAVSKSFKFESGYIKF